MGLFSSKTSSEDQGEVAPKQVDTLIRVFEGDYNMGIGSNIVNFYHFVGKTPAEVEQMVIEARINDKFLAVRWRNRYGEVEDRLINPAFVVSIYRAR